MAPREAYLSIKAAKAREDRHYGQLAVFVATLANVAGSGPKKRIKPDDLYKPNLKPPRASPEKRAETPEDVRARQRDLKKHVESLLARHGPKKK